MKYSVTVYGRRGFLRGENFADERKARDFYAEMLVRYPNYEVVFEKVEAR